MHHFFDGGGSEDDDQGSRQQSAASVDWTNQKGSISTQPYVARYHNRVSIRTFLFLQNQGTSAGIAHLV